MERSDYYFAIGRTIPYKRFDLLVDTFNANGKRLIIATSTDNLLSRTLRARSRDNIEWRMGTTDEERDRLYRCARAFLHPQEEDLGITPIEAMASGTSVIAYRRGGALETVVEGVTGEFFDAQTVEALSEGIARCEARTYDAAAIRKHAEGFSVERFRREIGECVGRMWEEWR